jgi:DNA (cytosine-5)-methyltransferase 1
MKFIDIFCGMGTIRMGFEQTGHECAYSVEWDKHKRRIYGVIFGAEPEGRDIRDTGAGDFPRSDCWCFGFPCQDISVAGKQLGFTGDRSSLFFEVMRILRETPEADRPKYLLIENVKNLLSVNSGWDFFNLQVALDEIGYDAEWDVLNSKNFGVPQNRERVFVVGHLRGRSTRKVFPICGNDETAADVQGQYTNTITRRYEGAQALGAYVVEGEQLQEVRRYGTLRGNASRTDFGVAITYDLKAPKSSTRRGAVKTERIGALDTQCDIGVREGTRIRRLTPRECMRLQGVPDEVTDKLIAAGISDTQLYRAAGDACTVPVIYEIARRM